MADRVEVAGTSIDADNVAGRLPVLEADRMEATEPSTDAANAAGEASVLAVDGAESTGSPSDATNVAGEFVPGKGYTFAPPRRRQMRNCKTQVQIESRKYLACGFVE